MTVDEGYTKFSCDWTRRPLAEFPETAQLCRCRQSLFDAGLIGEYTDIGIGFGNISMRVGNSGNFLISGTQTGHLDAVGPEHFALVTSADFDRNHVTCTGPVQASSESMTHAALYETDQSIRAVAHVHNDHLWRTLKDHIPTTSDDIAYGTPEMAREFARIYRDSDLRHSGIAVMGGHDAGLISIGSSVDEATARILALLRKHTAA